MSETIRTRGKSNSSDISVGREVPLSYNSISAQVSFLQGKVLTVIDATIVDERQLKAVKDLIKSAFSEQLSWICELCYPDLPIRSEDSLKAQGIDTDSVKRGAVEIRG